MKPNDLKPGDMIGCGDETGVILSFWPDPAGVPDVWIDVLWSNGEIEGIPVDEIDTVFCEVR